MENYQKLKEVIWKANPDFDKRLMQVNIGAGQEITVRDENIRLTDVLLAMYKAANEYEQNWLHVIRNWNLKDDNLDHQSDETKQFLINLLV
jgi:hypothetical protein